MTDLALDIRGPVIVVAGAFNPAIFSQSWVATNVFGIPEGAEMSVLEVLVQIDPQSLLQLRFFEGVAINVGPGRVELYAANGEPETFSAVETALRKVLELLPHTPIQAIGCNFRWVDSDPSPEVTDLFDSPEGLEGGFQIQARQFSAQIMHDNGILNFSRASMNNEVHFNFNYHRAVTNVADCDALVQGMISQDLGHSRGMMESLYAYDEFETLGYANNDQQGEIAHAAEAAD
jgi:hypothetical protein